MENFVLSIFAAIVAIIILFLIKSMLGWIYKHKEKIIHLIKEIINWFERYRVVHKLLIGWALILIVYYVFLILGIEGSGDDKNIIYRILEIYDKENVDITYGLIKNKLYEFKFAFINYSIICVIVIFINWIRNKIINHNILKKINNSENNVIELYKTLYEYIHDKNDKKPILIVGGWGSGKTYLLNQFFDNYFNKNLKQKVYKISCFGIENKESLLNNIRDVCENEDDSSFKLIISCIEKLPLIGEFLGNVLKKDYDLNSLKENSIFVFDNFERIIPKNMDNPHRCLEKYNIVSGVIDELVEVYNMKVIIVANENEMIPNYVSDCFMYKLSCRRFETFPNINVIEKVWKDIIENIKGLKNKEEFELIFEQYKDDIVNIWMHKSDNIRILKDVFYEFIVFVNKVEKRGYIFEKNPMDEKTGVLFTLLIIKVFKDEFEKENGLFSKIMLGECIGQYLDRLLLCYIDSGIVMSRVNIEELKDTFGNINARWYGGFLSNWENIIDNDIEILESISASKKDKIENLNKFDYEKNPIAGQVFEFEDIIVQLLISKGRFWGPFSEIMEKGTIIYGNNNSIADKIKYVDKIIEKYNFTTIIEQDASPLREYFCKKIFTDLGGKENILRIGVSSNFRKLIEKVN